MSLRYGFSVVALCTVFAVAGTSLAGAQCLSGNVAAEFQTGCNSGVSLMLRRRASATANSLCASVSAWGEKVTANAQNEQAVTITPRTNNAVGQGRLPLNMKAAATAPAFPPAPTMPATEPTAVHEVKVDGDDVLVRISE